MIFLGIKIRILPFTFHIFMVSIEFLIFLFRVNSSDLFALIMALQTIGCVGSTPGVFAI